MTIPACFPFAISIPKYAITKSIPASEVEIKINIIVSQIVIFFCGKFRFKKTMQLNK
jgi:hypothetical protein